MGLKKQQQRYRFQGRFQDICLMNMYGEGVNFDHIKTPGAPHPSLDPLVESNTLKTMVRLFFGLRKIFYLYIKSTCI